VKRLLLVRHAPTAATRSAAFPVDESLDERGEAAASTLAQRLPTRCEAVSSPSRRCQETAAAAGLRPRLEPRITECDFGTWAGRSLEDVYAEDPTAAAEWMTDPDACPHGGESLTAFLRRVVTWLEDPTAHASGYTVAVTHSGVVKASVVHALGAPPLAFWRIDVTPLAITELHAHDGRWTLTRVNCRAGGAE
jgi:broad specificity phosphatase PhoE